MVTLILMVAALVLSGLTVIRSKGTNELGWAVLALSLALLLPRLG